MLAAVLPCCLFFLEAPKQEPTQAEICTVGKTPTTPKNRIRRIPPTLIRATLKPFGFGWGIF